MDLIDCSGEIRQIGAGILLASTPLHPSQCSCPLFTTMFKRKSSNSRPELPRNLVPVGSFQTRRVYGTTQPRGNVYTPEGHFVQHADSFSDQQDDPFEAIAMDVIGNVEGHKPGKKERQFQRWEGEVLPLLMEPYIQLLAETDSLRNMADVRQGEGCQGCAFGRELKVACIFFESKCLEFTQLN